MSFESWEDLFRLMFSLSPSLMVDLANACSTNNIKAHIACNWVTVFRKGSLALLVGEIEIHYVVIVSDGFQ